MYTFRTYFLLIKKNNKKRFDLKIYVIQKNYKIKYTLKFELQTFIMYKYVNNNSYRYHSKYKY